MMQIKLNKKCTVDGKQHKSGAVVEVERRVGDKLVARGLAVEAAEAAVEADKETKSAD